MKTIQQLQEEVYEQALSSGYFKNMQAQLKNYVFDVSNFQWSWFKKNMEEAGTEDFNTSIHYYKK